MFAFDILLNLIFPPSCVSCDAPLDVLGRNALCGSCSEKFLNEKERKCPLCGKTHSECSCMPARLKKYCSDAMHVSEYSETDGVTRSLVLSAKDRNLKYLYDFIVNELAYLVRSRIGNAEGYIVSYVPRSKRKKAGTGVDQSALAARRLASELHLPLRKLFVHSGTAVQKKLSAEERYKNALNSYSLAKGTESIINGGNFILYDDVVTTGSTLTACASLLRRAGAGRIVILTFAKTYPGYASGQSTTPGRKRDPARLFKAKKKESYRDPRGR